jgi:hypothetical protein
LVTEDSDCEDENANAAKFLSIRQTVPLLSQEMLPLVLGKLQVKAGRHSSLSYSV